MNDDSKKEVKKTISSLSPDRLLAIAEQMSKETGKPVEVCMRIIIDLNKIECLSTRPENPPCTDK